MLVLEESGTSSVHTLVLISYCPFCESGHPTARSRFAVPSRVAGLGLKLSVLATLTADDLGSVYLLDHLDQRVLDCSVLDCFDLP